MQILFSYNRVEKIYIVDLYVQRVRFVNQELKIDDVADLGH